MDKLVVKEWLMKCKEKALNSVIKETEDLLVSYADVYPEIADGFNKKLQIKDLIQQIKEEYPKLKVNYHIGVQCHAPAYRDVKFGDLPAFALAYLRQNEMNEELENYGVIEAENTPALIYTALTRAKCNLFIINLGNQKYDEFFKTKIKN